MPDNQFSPFGLGPGSYVLTPSAYAALAVRTSGFPPGKVLKEDLNTPIRQASSVATMLANFIQHHQPDDVNDDGDLVTLEDQLLAALNSLYGTGIAGLIVTAQADSTSFPGTKTINLHLTPGLWLIDAQASLSPNPFAVTLSIDGVVKQSFSDSAEARVMAAYSQVTVVTTRDVAVAWDVESGGTSFPQYLRALAQKIG